MKYRFSLEKCCQTKERQEKKHSTKQKLFKHKVLCDMYNFYYSKITSDIVFDHVLLN